MARLPRPTMAIGALIAAMVVVAGAVVLGLWLSGTFRNSQNLVRLPPPRGVHANAFGYGEIELKWLPVSRVRDYWITYYRGGSPVGSVGTSRDYQAFPGLAPSTRYCFFIQSEDSAGRKSRPSRPPACATTHSAFPKKSSSPGALGPPSLSAPPVSFAPREWTLLVGEPRRYKTLAQEHKAHERVLWRSCRITSTSTCRSTS